MKKPHPPVIRPEGSFFFRDYTNKTKNPDHDSARLAESRYVVPFNINNMHPGQVKLLLSRDKLAEAVGNPASIADLLADIIATSKEDTFHNLEQRMVSNVDMYKAALHDHGFNNSDWKNLAETLKRTLGVDGHVMWIIAGCQDKVLVSRRAKAAAFAFAQVAELLTELHHHIIYCGAHPPVDRVDLPNEAVLLGECFRTSLAQISGPIAIKLEKGFPKWHEIYESKSTTTHENIRLSFAEVVNTFRPQKTSGSPYATMIISNDFHLIRLSRDFRHFRRTQNITCLGETGELEQMSVKACERFKKLTFKGLFLLGSEFFSPIPTAEALEKASDPAAFTKRIYFEVLSDFFRRNYFLPDATFLRNQSPDPYRPSDNDVITVDEPLASLIVPGLDTTASIAIGLRLNRFVFHPVTPEQLMPAVERAIMRNSDESGVQHGFSTDKERSAALRSLRMIHRLGGRFTQPTVRIAGEPRLTYEAPDKWRLRIDLAKNYEGVALGAQTGVLGELEAPIATTLQSHQMLSLNVSILYVYKKDGKYFTLLRKRSANRYVYPNKAEASIEGPVYLVDFAEREHLDLSRPVLRLLKKEFLGEWSKNQARSDLLNKWSEGKDWNQDFHCLGYSQSSVHSHSCIHGILQGPQFPLPQFNLPNDLVDKIVEVPLTIDGIESGLDKLTLGTSEIIVPSSFITLLMGLKWLKKQKDFELLRKKQTMWVAPK